MLWLFAAAAFAGTPLIMTPQMFGASPDDGVDDAAAFEAALASLEAGASQIPDVEATLSIGPGVWKLENIDNRKHSLHITSPVRISCAPGAILEGDLTPGDHLVPPEDWTSKRMLSIQPGSEADVKGVTIEGCTFRFGRAHAANEQAAAIHATAPNGTWLRGLVIRDVTCEVVGSGDCIYVGTQVEDVTIERVHAVDVARNVVTFGGSAGPSNIRTGYHVDGVHASWTFDAPGQTDGNAVDFEPSSSALDDRFYDVHVSNVFAPTGSVDLANLHGGLIENLHVTKVSSGRLNGTKVVGLLLDCLEGAWGDGVGACWSHKAWPAVFTVEDLVARVHPNGAGVLALRDVQASATDAQSLVNVEMHGRVQFNGDVVERTVADTSGFYSDRLRVVTGFTVVPDPVL